MTSCVSSWDLFVIKVCTFGDECFEIRSYKLVPCKPECHWITAVSYSLYVPPCHQ